MTTNDSVWSQLKSLKWSADIDDMITWQIAVSDGKDTARIIAKKVLSSLTAHIQ